MDSPRVVGGSPGGQADFALGQGEPRERIHDQQHVLAGIAKIFRHGGRGLCRLHPHECRLIAGGDNDHAAGQPLRSQIPLDEFVDFAAALANQADDNHIGRRVAGHHSQRHALAYARAGENAQPLADAAGQQAIDRSDAGGECLVDPRPIDGRRRFASEWDSFGEQRLGLAVDRFAAGVDHAAK